MNKSQAIHRIYLLNIIALGIFVYLSRAIKLLQISKILSIILVSEIILSIIYILLRYHSLKRYITFSRIRNNIEKNLISIDIYDKYNTSILFTPSISISDSKIIINMNNIKFRKKIESYSEQFSSALPDFLIVENMYFNKGGNKLIIEYDDSLFDKRIIYKSLSEYKDKILKLPITQFEFDHKHIIDLNEYSHFLVSGTTGSGKSYLSQQILIQALIKKFDVYVLDYKRSYQIFKNYTHFSTNPIDILNTLKQLEQIMIDRMNKMEEFLEKDPNAIAVNYGIQPIVIIIEEYIGLMSALDSKSQKEIERIIKSISVLARSVNMHLFMVMQSASTENVNPSIRHNLSKILLGNAQSNIIISTFGNGTEIPKLNTKLEKGEGYIQLGEMITRLKVPTLSYTNKELKEIL